MKSVCILVQNHYEIDIRVRRKAEALVATGFSVDVLALASSYSTCSHYMLNGVNVFTLSLDKKRGSLARYVFEYAVFFLWSFFKLSGLMGKRHYGMVDVNNLPDFLVFAAGYAKFRGAKIIFDMHEITPEFCMSKYNLKEGSPILRLLKVIERASFNFADHVITINDPIKELLASRGLPATQTTVIMNAVDESMFTSAGGAPAASATEEARGKFVMMYHGTLAHIYGLDIAIEAFSRTHEAMPGAEFWILGNGPEKETLERLVRDLDLGEKVKFIRNVLPQEVRQWLKQCDVGVLATRRDVFLDYSYSNKLSEYIVMGKPVISSRLKTIRHYFSDEALAYFEPNDPTDLARQMVRLFRDAGHLRVQLTENAKQEYAPVSWEVMKHRYLKLMAAIVGIQQETAARSASSTANVTTR